MKLLTSSKNAEKELNLMGIYNSFDLISYLPYRYESFEYSLKKEKELVDKERVVIYGRLVSNPKFIKTHKLDIIKFFFANENGSFFSVVAYNRPYLMNILNSVIGTLRLQAVLHLLLLEHQRWILMTKPIMNRNN